MCNTSSMKNNDNTWSDLTIPQIIQSTIVEYSYDFVGALWVENFWKHPNRTMETVFCSERSDDKTLCYVKRVTSLYTTRYYSITMLLFVFEHMYYVSVRNNTILNIIVWYYTMSETVRLFTSHINKLRSESC